MAIYNQVSSGSSDSATVKKLQEMLNQNGYSLDVDGSFGPKTDAAVRDYQKKNNLAVDGIVGTNTWGALTKANTPATTTPTTTPTTTQTNTPKDGGFSYKPYQKSDVVAQAEALLQQQLAQKPGAYTSSDSVTQAEMLLQQHLNQKPGAYTSSDAVTQAEMLLQQHLAQKPGEYTSAWQTQLDETLNKILNREKFSYDLNGDALYQQYKDQYTTQGQLAMMDTMGQAAALNGGYGSSYAQSVGQQAYQGYLQQLNDKVPELYQLALDQYNREGDELYNQYGLYADRENQDYGRYRDSVSDYYTNLDYYTNDARYKAEQDYGKYRDSVSDYYTGLDYYTNDARYKAEQDYGKYRDSVSDYYTGLNYYTDNARYQAEQDYNKWADKLNLDYGMYRDQVGDQQWQAEFDEAKRQYDQAYALENGSSSSGSKGGSTSGNGNKGNTGGSYTKNPGWDEEKIRKFQQAKGITVDGKWGPETAGKYDEDPNWSEGGGGGTGFTGTTYSEAVAYMTANGVPNSTAAFVLQKREYQRSPKYKELFGSYEEYLSEFVEDSIEQSKK